MNTALPGSVRFRTSFPVSRKTLVLIASLIYLLYYIFTGRELPSPSSSPTPTPPSSTPTPTLSTNNATESASVSRVIDGDTIMLSDGREVRYIGVDTPETKDPRRPVGCFGEEAYQKNKELVEGKIVLLVKDISETDKYGRLLRYVYVGDLFVNDYLVREGYARVSTYPPDIAHQPEFIVAEKEAQSNNRGLWKSCLSR